jgi:hypothetical protein
MGNKVLITIHADHVAPRFDLATEVLIVSVGSDGNLEDQRTIVLPQSSPEDLCNLILAENVGYVFCGGIEEEYYQYLIWKKVNVIDSMMGPYGPVLERIAQGGLHQDPRFPRNPGGLQQ